MMKYLKHVNRRDICLTWNFDHECSCYSVFDSISYEFEFKRINKLTKL